MQWLCWFLTVKQTSYGASVIKPQVGIFKWFFTQILLPSYSSSDTFIGLFQWQKSHHCDIFGSYWAKFRMTTANLQPSNFEDSRQAQRKEGYTCMSLPTQRPVREHTFLAFWVFNRCHLNESCLKPRNVWVWGVVWTSLSNWPNHVTSL